jgi:hypothetical protein
MADPLRATIADLVRRAGEQGLTMGELVDRLVGDGAAESEVEASIWAMLAQRRLTPAGYVARRLRRGDTMRRSYEFLLVSWSPDLDRQLELPLAEGEP